MANQVHTHEGTKKMAPHDKGQNLLKPKTKRKLLTDPWLVEFFPELNSDDLHVIAWIKDFYQYRKVKKKTHNNLVHIWIDYGYCLSQLPFLRAKTEGSLYNLLRKLVKIGVMVPHPDNMGRGKSYYGFTKRFWDLCNGYATEEEEAAPEENSTEHADLNGINSTQQSSSLSNSDYPIEKDKTNIIMAGYSKKDQVGIREGGQIRKKVHNIIRRDKTLMDKFLRKGEVPLLVDRFMRHWDDAECRYFNDNGLLKYLHSWIGYQVVEEPEPEHSEEIKEVIGILTKLWGEKKYRKSDIAKIQKFLDEEPDYGAKAIHVLADHVADHFEPSYRNVSFILGKLWEDHQEDVKYALDGGW